MTSNEPKKLKVAILDLYEGVTNQGMRCIRTILQDWATANELELQVKEYDVRLRNELPDTSYDIYISSGGPGDPARGRRAGREAGRGGHAAQRRDRRR